MRWELLHEWLRLPPGTWPPNHYTLLGLDTSETSLEQIESHAMERMERLRRYQLIHPEEVTEGMNRIAQALVCLSNPQSRIAYDRTIGLTAPDEPDSSSPSENLTTPTFTTTSPNPKSLVTTAPSAEHPIAELANSPNTHDGNLPVNSQTVSENNKDSPDDADDGMLPIILLEEDVATGSAPSPEALSNSQPLPHVVLLPSATSISVHRNEHRRPLYTRIVLLRRALHHWKSLEPFLADPNYALSRHTDAMVMVEHLGQIYRLLPALIPWIGNDRQPGYLVALLARQPLAAQMFRSFLPSQRQTLAEHWKNGYAYLLELYRKSRRELRRATAKGWWRRTVKPAVRRLWMDPEWILFLGGIIAVVIALLRTASAL